MVTCLSISRSENFNRKNTQQFAINGLYDAYVCNDHEEAITTAKQLLTDPKLTRRWIAKVCIFLVHTVAEWAEIKICKYVP
jgi:hypothetical protein